MSETEKKPSKRLQFFKEIVENLPKRTGDSFANKVADLESAKLIHKAGEVTLDEMTPKPELRGLEKGISEGLEDAGKKIVSDKLTQTDPIRKGVDEALGEWVKGTLTGALTGGGGKSVAELELARRDRVTELEGMFQQFQEQVVKPLADQLGEIQKTMKPAEGAPAGKTLSEDEAIDAILSAEERAKALLAKRGYSVESITLTKEDVKKILDEERAKTEALLTTKKAEWEKESGANVQIETERIRATEDILNNAIGRVFDIFLEPIKIKIQEAIEKGAFKSAGA